MCLELRKLERERKKNWSASSSAEMLFSDFFLALCAASSSLLSRHVLLHNIKNAFAAWVHW